MYLCQNIHKIHSSLFSHKVNCRRPEKLCKILKNNTEKQENIYVAILSGPHKWFTLNKIALNSSGWKLLVFALFWNVFAVFGVRIQFEKRKNITKVLLMLLRCFKEVKIINNWGCCKHCNIWSCSGCVNMYLLWHEVFG